MPKVFGSGPQSAEAGEEDRDAGGVVPTLHGVQAASSGDPGEENGAGDIAEEREKNADRKYFNAVANGQAIEFAEEESGHDNSLKGTDAAARGVDLDNA